MKRVAVVVSAVALLASVLGAGELPASAQTSQVVDAPPAGEWLAGDLHVHTTYSHDSYGGPDDDNTDPFEEPPGSFEDLIVAGHPVTSEVAVAASRGLDYVAITDHNDVRSQSDPGWETAKDLGVIPVPGYENSLNGHAQMLGATKVYDNGDRSPATINTLADQLRGDGGVFQINHPTDGDGRYPDNMGWGYGFDVVPDQIEVWNITRAWQKPAPSSNSADDATLYWQEWLDKGYHVAATGGSDTHWLTTTAAQGVGQPTTWVYATEDSAEGVLEGLKQGRTFISHQPPNYGGAQIFLEADANGDGSFESLVGDTVPTGAQLRVRVEGAPGSLLRVVTDHGLEAFEPVPVTSPSFIHNFTLPAGTWVRAEVFEPDAQEQRRELCDQPFGEDTTYCRNQIGVIAMTSALYLGSGMVVTKLTLDGSPTAGRYSDDVTAVATLTDAAGAAISGEPVEFSFTAATGSRAFSAVTQADGTATITFPLTEAPGAADLRAHYAGEPGSYAATSAYLPFVIDKEITQLAVATTGKGSKTLIVATLTDDETNPVTDKPIRFSADGHAICTEPAPRTDTQGRATCEPPPRNRGGQHAARFEADEFYLGSPPV